MCMVLAEPAWSLRWSWVKKMLLLTVEKEDAIQDCKHTK